MSKKVSILTAMDPYKDIRADKMAETLSLHGFDVTVLSGFSDINFQKETVYSVVSYNIPYNIKSNVFMKFIWKLRFSLYLLKVLKNIKPDIIQACNIDMLVIAYLYGFRKTKIVYDSYEICAHKSGVASKSRFLSWFIEKIELFLVNKIDTMFCVSNSAKRYFENKYGIKKLSMITNVPKNTQLIRSKAPAKPMRVLYIGNFSPHRGIEELIFAGKHIDENSSMIHLQGFGAYEEDFKKLVKEMKVENTVSFIEPILPQTVIENISKNADIGVVLTKATSINHNLTVSNKIFDYINAGLPVIMSNVEEHKYLNEKYNFGIIINEITPIKIAEAINLLVNDINLYQKLSENCLKAAKELNWSVEKNKLLNVYNKYLV